MSLLTGRNPAAHLPGGVITPLLTARNQAAHLLGGVITPVQDGDHDDDEEDAARQNTVDSAHSRTLWACPRDSGPITEATRPETYADVAVGVSCVHDLNRPEFLETQRFGLRYASPDRL